MTLKCSNFKRGLWDFQEFHVTRFHAKFPRNLNLNFTWNISWSVIYFTLTNDFKLVRI
jgi:hypothetical protein